MANATIPLDTGIPRNIIRVTSSKMLYSRILDERNKTEPDTIVVFFFANWCSGSHRITSQLRDLARSRHEINFFLVDVDTQEEIAVQNKVEATPAFWFPFREPEVGEVRLVSEQVPGLESSCAFYANNIWDVEDKLPVKRDCHRC
eukprot:TRINITY_DN50844_c0_g1_i1.p1 TRINITY_DN50844_c0_g1~~TRINITY_DN50844_c0_g1_i1.p1  ORF type:complete len:160 (+),score=17.52 TRINITY_DN50844_c0_g1_i1:48-482(+)